MVEYGWRAELRFLKENLDKGYQKTNRKLDDFRNEIKKRYEGHVEPNGSQPK